MAIMRGLSVASLQDPVGCEWITSGIAMLYLGNQLLLAEEQVRRRQSKFDKVRQTAQYTFI